MDDKELFRQNEILKVKNKFNNLKNSKTFKNI